MWDPREATGRPEKSAQGSTQHLLLERIPVSRRLPMQGLPRTANSHGNFCENGLASISAILCYNCSSHLPLSHSVLCRLKKKKMLNVAAAVVGRGPETYGSWRMNEQVEWMIGICGCWGSSRQATWLPPKGSIDVINVISEKARNP